jgi:proteasome lid subunit RPN8/RPN11
MHALQASPAECCGLIVAINRRHIYLPCKNLAAANEHFIIDPLDYAAAEDKGQIIAIVHSHPSTNPAPSQTDLIGIERSGLPWLIVNPHTGAHTITMPSGYIAPLIGREFHHGVLDCLSLIRDYYKQTLNIDIPDYVRQDQWWLKGENLYRDKFTECGFFDVPLETLQQHDILIMRMASPVENHGAVYVGNNQILQHVSGRLSSRDVFGGYWRKATTLLIRHGSLM